MVRASRRLTPEFGFSSIDSMGNVRNRSGNVILPPPGGEILWRSEARLYEGESDVFLNDTFVVGCAVGYQINGSRAPNCEFQYKVVCAGDTNLRLVDHVRENAWANESELELQQQSDAAWQRARDIAANLSCGNETHPGSDSNLSACNVSDRQVRPPLGFLGFPPLLMAKVGMQSDDWMLVPLSQVSVQDGLQGKSCRLLECGCGMCLLTNDSIIHNSTYNYSRITSLVREKAVPASTFGSSSGMLPSYKALPYMIQGGSVTVECNFGHRVGSHDASSQHQYNLTCNASHYANRNDAAQSDHWNCGFRLPQPCKPVSCGRYVPPQNSTVLSGDWSAERVFYYAPSAAPLRVQCHPGFYTTLTNPQECSQNFEVTCSAEGQWTPEASCVPIRCGLTSLKVIGTGLLPDNNTLIELAPVAGTGTYHAYQTSVSVGIGNSVHVKCAQDYKRSDDGTIAPVCMDQCRLSPAVISCKLFSGVCPRWDSFELGPGVELNEYLMTLDTIPAFATRNLECKTGYQLDNSDEAVVIAGLEALGPVSIKTSASFPPPTDLSQPIALPLPGASIEVPPGAWPAGAGPLSAGVFDLRSSSSSRRADREGFGGGGSARRLLTVGNDRTIVSDCVNFGPDGLELKKPVTLTLPFDYQSAAPYRNPNFELAIWKLDVEKGDWIRKPYPEGEDSASAVDWERRVVVPAPSFLLHFQPCIYSCVLEVVADLGILHVPAAAHALLPCLRG